MKISVCMIVKNEEQTLSRILDCATDFADEIIITDTGSTDGTKEIAKRYTDKIFDYEWRDNFADARNFSFSKATCDYIMWLDADDYISQKNIEKIKALKNSKTLSDCYMLKYQITSSTQDNSDFIFYRERIVKNDGTFIWYGFIHEAMIPHSKIEYCDITIEHRKEKCKNPKRNLEIYRKNLKRGEKLNARETYYYAKELYYNGYYSACIREVNSFLKFSQKFMPNVVDAYAIKARCLICKGKYQRAINCLLSAMKDIEPNAEICCICGDCFVKLNNINNAIFWYKNALNSDNDITSGAFVDTKYSTIIPCLQLCSLYYRKGDKATSEIYHNKAKEFSPENKIVKYNQQFF